MSTNLEPAILLPIKDIQLSRDVGRKLRIAGYVTGQDPKQPIIMVTHESKSILIDLSLCVYGHQDDQGGWKEYRNQLKLYDGSVFPPPLKSKVMIVGYLEQLDVTPLDLSFLLDNSTRIDTTSQVKTDSQIENIVHEFLIPIPPDPNFVLRAILFKEMGHEFDLHLWVTTARIRSQYEWKGRESETGRLKGKAKS